MNKNDFIAAKPGTLWVSPFTGDTALKFGIGIGLDSYADPTKTIGGFELFSSAKEKLKKFWVVPHGTVIMKLKEEYVDNKPYPKLEIAYYKVMAQVVAGEMKVGWMASDSVKHLVPYEA